MSALLGGSVNLTAVDHAALASANLRMDTLLGAVQAATSAATPEAAAQLDLSLGTIFSAAASAASGQGLSAAATALNTLATQSNALPTGTIALADLLTLDTRSQTLAASQLNLLDFVNASASLFNYENAATVNSVHVSGVALGLGSLLNEVDIAARVISPPVFACGPTGTQFYSAGVRLRLHVDLVDTSVSLSLLGLTGLASVNLVLLGTDIVVDLARGAGTLQTINAVGNAVTVQATPGITSLYFGTVG
ncbi:MAG TPA: hypothetical protein VMF89_14885, partial [Polyangiales bacterium]|nr:hypothetical protein [Polyangiales bacterium]